MTTSDLSNFYRIPKINITLPSQGKYYPEGFIDTSINNTIPIKQMTAKDELILKTPDALLNGDSILHIIKSCMPSIKDARQLVIPDVESIILGIFFASFGPNLEFAQKCPKCSHENEFQAPIRNILDSQSYIEFPSYVEKSLGEIDGNQTKIVVHVKPYTFECNTRQQLALFEQSKIVQAMSKDDARDEQSKVQIASECIHKMIEIKFENITSSITKIEIHKLINSEWQIQSIEDKEEIKDFSRNADKDLVDPVIQKIEELNKVGVNNKFNAQCQKEECQHTWETQIEFNPSTFFVKNSKH